jgi:hypothetical protein
MDEKSYDINKLFEFFKYWKDYTHPTEFYNEGWLLKLLVYAVTGFGLKEHPLYVNEKDKFFSEGLLRSPFLTKGKKNRLAESHTHADGAIGNFTIGNDNSKGLLELKGNKLNIFEAKINSGFSKKVTNAPFYNQAARYVACIAETINNADKIKVLNNLSIGFYLVLPKDKYETKNFKKFLDEDHILETVKRRVGLYKDEADYKARREWFEEIFSLVLEKIEIEHLFYEDVIAELQGYKYIDEINDFYNACIKCN